MVFFVRLRAPRCCVKPNFWNWKKQGYHQEAWPQYTIDCLDKVRQKSCASGHTCCAWRHSSFSSCLHLPLCLSVKRHDLLKCLWRVSEDKKKARWRKVPVKRTRSIKKKSYCRWNCQAERAKYELVKLSYVGHKVQIMKSVKLAVEITNQTNIPVNLSFHYVVTNAVHF